MFCGNCGTKQLNQANFCTSCGFPRGEHVPKAEFGQSNFFNSLDPLANYLPSNAPTPKGPVESVVYCLKNWDNFEGRAARSEFWFYYLFNFLTFSLLLSTASAAIKGNSAWFAWIIPVFLVISIMPVAAASTRRLHDVGKKGTYWFWGLIPYVGAIMLFIRYAERGEPHANNFGPPSR
jgi:uncharacterized membrane protein YhaH (DUF805 family)